MQLAGQSPAGRLLLGQQPALQRLAAARELVDQAGRARRARRQQEGHHHRPDVGNGEAGGQVCDGQRPQAEGSGGQDRRSGRQQ